MASISKGRNNPKEGSKGKKRRSVFSESDDNASKGSASYGKKSCEFPLSKIYNSSLKSQAPAELFRKDLISAMKLADSEQLLPDDYWLISDTWKEEWEKGVQVPVNPDKLPETNIRILRDKRPQEDTKKHFKLPRKLIKFSDDKNYSPDIHVLTNAPARHLKVCSYDLDIVDIEWLKCINEELKMIGLPCLDESTMELAMEKIENQCFYKLQEAIRTEEGLGIEYDDDVICDVCRSPDSEEGNEMVFCDACNVCVHQACYGITKIPEGSWVCRSCALGIRPSCILCPNVGGAMKSTRSGQKWTHVSCALWIPEVAIENVEKMEPITKISEIPASRWALVCSLCREKIGACIQCSVKTCKTAYHVTCAFQHGLAMKAIIDDDEEEDDVDLKSYCLKHTKEKKGKSEELTDHGNSKNSKKELEMSNEEKASARLARIKQMEAEFYRYVNIREVARSLKLDISVVDFIYQYWILKRKANFDRPLVIPKSKPAEPEENKPVNSLYARMKMFVHLRQDLERARNLCYMVTKRERLSRTWCRIKRDIFLKQAEIISNNSLNYKENEKQAILNANHGDTIYDIMSSCQISSNPSLNSILSALGEKTHRRKECGTPKQRKSSSSSPLQRLPNPYAKQYVNSVLKRSQRSSTESCTEQDEKWRAMSENQRVSHKKSKDIANKLAALEEVYNLKPMEIIVDKLPEDHDTCVQFSLLQKGTNISPVKRNSRAFASPVKLHSEPSKKRAKVCLSSRNKAMKYNSKIERKRISLERTSPILSECSESNTCDASTKKFGDSEKRVINQKRKENFSHDLESKINVNNHTCNKAEFHKCKEETLLNSQKEKTVSTLQITVIYENNNHHEGQNNHIILNEEKLDNQQTKDENNCDIEKKANKTRNKQEGAYNISSDRKENEISDNGKCDDGLISAELKSLNLTQNKQESNSNKENETEMNLLFDHKKNSIYIHNKDDEICIAGKDESVIVTHNKEESEKHLSEANVVNYQQIKNADNCMSKNSFHRKEENGHTNHKRWEKNQWCSKVSVISHKKDDTGCIDPIAKENNIKNEETKVINDIEENEKHPKTDLIIDRAKDDRLTINNINEFNDIQKRHDNNENEIKYCEKQENDLDCSHENEANIRWKEKTENNICRNWETEFNGGDLLKDIKISVQRYIGGNIIEESSNLRSEIPKKEVSVDSCEAVQDSSCLCELEKLQLQANSVIEDKKDVCFPESVSESTQPTVLRKLSKSEMQIVKMPTLNELNENSGNMVNPEKSAGYEQRLMNSKKPHKEDIITPAKPLIENSKVQKLNERSKLSKSHSYKKYEKLKKSSNVMKNGGKSLLRSSFKCSQEERTCKKIESNLVSTKHPDIYFVKDVSRQSDLEIETQKGILKDKKPQIAIEKTTPEAIIRENFNPVCSKEDICKNLCSRMPTSHHSLSPNSTSSEMLNKKLSPKPNMHKYNVPEKLHNSSSSSQSHSSLAVPFNKDTMSGKEKLRQESAKVRESLFAASSYTAKSLSGYKIPKKSRTDSIENNSVQSNKETCKSSPLYGVCQIPQTETYPQNGYRTDRKFRGCKYAPRVRRNGEKHSQEQRLLLKLNKESSYSSARWQSDPSSSGRRDSLCIIPNNAFSPHGRKTHCDRSKAPVDSSTDTGGYWVCEDSSGNFTKHFPQNVQNGDYGLS